MVVEMLPQTRAIELTQEQKAFVAMNNDFSFNLYRAIQAADNKKSNITSPLSVAYVLGMLNNGATSITAKEIAKVLGFGDGDKQAINNYCKALIEQAPITDPSVTLQIANIVAANQNVNLEDTYKKNVTDYYSAEVASLDFSQKSSVDYLNGWCNEKSMGMIPEIIENYQYTNKYLPKYWINEDIETAQELKAAAEQKTRPSHWLTAPARNCP